MMKARTYLKQHIVGSVTVTVILIGLGLRRKITNNQQSIGQLKLNDEKVNAITIQHNGYCSKIMTALMKLKG